MIGLPYGDKNYDNTLSRFHTIPERNGRTDRQTDGRTDSDNKTILKLRLTAAAGRQYVYVGFSRRKIPRSSPYTISEKAIRFQHPTIIWIRLKS